ncbi:MAG: 3,4-dihydroxy-2-butanone-4-phosphate synthase [Desulfurococcales archaeon]|nr:3,4-dihydroxy-2-butanone-4-phosphate synthase [Desulfurococcales archaeon]
MWGVDEAVKAFKRGLPVMIHDSSSRENEVDLIYYAGRVNPDIIYMLRTRAGGLICYATTQGVVEALGLDFMDNIMERLGGVYKDLSAKTPSYGDRPAFVLWVNHVSTKTGITDSDRAVTVSKLHEVTRLVLAGEKERARLMFRREFQSPGHVPLLAARPLRERRGHTELSITLALLAGLEPSVVFAEMLTRGGRLSVAEAEALSEKNGWPLLEGSQIVEACKDAGLCGSD